MRVGLFIPCYMDAFSQYGLPSGTSGSNEEFAMNAREDILARVHRNRPAGDHPLPLIPHFVIPGPEQGRLETFSRAPQAMGRRFLRSNETSSPLAWIREHIPNAKIICSAVIVGG